MNLPRKGYLALHPLVVDENTVPQYYRLLPTDDPNHQLAPLISNTELELDAGRGGVPRVTFLRAPTTTRSTHHVAGTWDEEQQTAPLGVAIKVSARKVKENLYRLITFYLAFVPFCVTTGFLMSNNLIIRGEDKREYTSDDFKASLIIAPTGAFLLLLALTPLVAAYIRYYHYPICVRLRRIYAKPNALQAFTVLGAYVAMHVVCDVAGTVVLRYGFGVDLGGIDAGRAAYVGLNALAFPWIAMFATAVVVWLFYLVFLSFKYVVDDIMDEDNFPRMPPPMSVMDHLLAAVMDWAGMRLHISV